MQALTALDADGLIGEVKKLRGKKKPVTVADMKRLKQEHAASVVPLQALEREADGLERQVSDLVNEAFGLTPEDVRLLLIKRGLEPNNSKSSRMCLLQQAFA